MATMGLAHRAHRPAADLRELGPRRDGAARRCCASLQGLALGGEYGGAATYVAEHVPDDAARLLHELHPDHRDARLLRQHGRHRRARASRLGEDGFKAWGWRVPFLLSFVLLGVSLYIRLQDARVAAVREAEERRASVSKNPLKESFTNPVNLRYVLIALFGATAGQGVVWYTGQFYALTFLQTALKLDWKTAYLLVVGRARRSTTPLFVFFGRLSRSHRAQADHARRLRCSARSPTCRSTWRMKHSRTRRLATRSRLLGTCPWSLLLRCRWST